MASNSVLNMMDGEGFMRRGAQRRRVMLVAKLVTSASTFDIRIRDVSATGARIEGDRLPPQGSDVVLQRGAFSVFGRLVWVNGSNGGIAFDEPRDDDSILDELKGIGSGPVRAPEPYKRPGFDHRASPPPVSDGRGWIRLPSGGA